MRNIRGSLVPPLSRIDGMRLILESTPSDDDIRKRLEDLKVEIKAVDDAVHENGSYLGIPERDKLKERLKTLQESRDLVQDEQELLRQIRLALAEEERKVAEQSEQTAAESPGKGTADSNLSAKDTTSHLVDAADQATVGATGSTALKAFSPSRLSGGYLPRQMKDAGFSEFLKNAAIGRAASSEKRSSSRSPAASTPTSSKTTGTGVRKHPIPFNIQGRGGDNMDDDRPLLR